MSEELEALRLSVDNARMVMSEEIIGAPLAGTLAREVWDYGQQLAREAKFG